MTQYTPTSPRVDTRSYICGRKPCYLRKRDVSTPDTLPSITSTVDFDILKINLILFSFFHDKKKTYLLHRNY